MPARPIVLVTPETDGVFTVRVSEGNAETKHVVSVPSGLGKELGLGGVPGEELVRASFDFLLEREPATSILGKFSLELISRYFPEYRREIHKYI